MSSQARKPKRWRIARCLKLTVMTIIVLAMLLVVTYHSLRPDVSDRREIFSGVFLTVEETAQPDHGSGRIMIVEVYWDTPGIEIHNRPFSYPIATDDPQSPHFRLTNADWALLTGDAAVLMNTTRYHPDHPTHSLPGKPVRSVETVVADGHVSHVHEHSYLMYMDHQGNAIQLFNKPPDRTSLSAAVWGIGLQGIQVSDRKARYQAIGNLDEKMPRSFIGLDPEKKILYLIAFENADGKLMIDRSVQAGVVVGGQVDSGGGTTLLIGPGATGVTTHCGIRNWRPLGAYLTIQAEKLSR